jgi:hypothetical protein
MERLRDEHFARLHPPVGEIIVQWGLLDVTLHYLASSMLTAIGTTAVAYGWPHSFGSRLERLEDLFRKRLAFKQLLPTAKATFKLIRNHQKLRNMLVHGAAIRYDPKKDAVAFRRIDKRTQKELKRKPTIAYKEHGMLVRFEMLHTASAELLSINSSLQGLLKETMALSVPSKEG